jgi:hypothetical protein
MIVKVRPGCSVAIACACVVLALPALAWADEPENVPPEPPSPPRNWDVELGAEATYTSPPIRGGTSPFGAGFGARVGVNVSGFYAGLGALYYLGGSDVTLSDRALLYGLEVGYGFRVQPVSWAWFTVRPLVGVGDAAIAHTDPSLAKVDVVTTASGRSSSSTSDTITVNNVYLRPGITAMLSSSTNYVALTGNVLVVPGISYGGSSEPTTWFSYGLQGELGFRF